jgi:hypothetical protein
MAVMAHDHPTWGQERIADELKLKLGIRSLAADCQQVLE